MTDLDVIELQQTIGMEFIKNAPGDGWTSGDVSFRQVGKTYEAKAAARDAAGAYVGGRTTMTMTKAFRALRKAFAHPEKGTWFTAVCTITPEGRMSFDFDYDNEPTWTTPTDVGHYLEEWEQYPRSPQFTPAWLAERLEQARAAAGH